MYISSAEPAQLCASNYCSKSYITHISDVDAVSMLNFCTMTRDLISRRSISSLQHLCRPFDVTLDSRACYELRRPSIFVVKHTDFVRSQVAVFQAGGMTCESLVFSGSWCGNAFQRASQYFCDCQHFDSRHRRVVCQVLRLSCSPIGFYCRRLLRFIDNAHVPVHNARNRLRDGSGVGTGSTHGFHPFMWIFSRTHVQVPVASVGTGSNHDFHPRMWIFLYSSCSCTSCE